MTSLRTLLAFPLLLVALACGGSGSGDAVSTMLPPSLTATFTGSGQASSPDRVRMTGQAVDATVVLSVVLGGPSTSTDIHSFAFDIYLSDPSVAEYVAGSASAGTVLVAEAGQQIAALASQNGSRITMGVAKLGGGPGNGIGGGEETVVELTFRVLRPGVAFVRFEDTPNGMPPAALDSTGSTIGSIRFDSSSARTVGM